MIQPTAAGKAGAGGNTPQKPGPKPAVISSQSAGGATSQQQAVIGTLVAPVGSGTPQAAGIPLAGGTITLLSPSNLPPASANINTQIRFVSRSMSNVQIVNFYVCNYLKGI